MTLRTFPGLIALALILVACKDASVSPPKPQAPAGHAANGESGDAEDHKMTDLGSSTAGPFTIRASREECADAACGELPVDVIQALFASLDPVLAERKFAAFAALEPASDAAQDFVALEDWLNDGVSLAAPVARECLTGWYGGNAPARGDWRIAGDAIDPVALDLPSLVVIPAHDRIVPPESAEALGRRLRKAAVMRPNVGHIGMMVSRGVESALWPRIAEWLHARN